MSDQELQVYQGQQPPAIQPSGGVIRLADKLDSVVESFREYTKACEALLNKDDYQGIGNRQFKKKSGWRKIATAFGVSTRIVSSKVEYDEDGRIHHAEFVVEAFAPNGRTAQAWAGASRVDRDYSHDQDVAATAQTRATNRAIADLIGCGEVSAEEMLQEKQEQRQERKQTQKSAESQQPQGELVSIGQIVSVVERSSKPDAPKKWTAFFVRFTCKAGESEAATFDTKLADLAHTLTNTNEMAKITTGPGRKPGTRELLRLEPAEQPPAEVEPDSIPEPEIGD